MEIKHAFIHRVAICSFVVFASLGCFSLAHAKGYAPAVAKNSTGFDIKFGSNGTPIANMSNTASGVAVGATVALPLSSSVIIQAAATGAVSGAAAAGAWGAAVGTLGAVALVALPVVLDWMNSAGVKVASDGSLGSPDPNSCTVGPCYEYQASLSGYNSQFGSKSSAHSGLLVLLQNSSSTGYYQWSAGSVEPCRMVRRDEYGAVEGGTFSCAYSSRQIPANSQPALIPLSVDEAVTKMTAPSPTQAQVQALIDLNFPPVVTPPNVVGSPRAYLGNTVQMFSPNEKKIVESWANLDYSQPGKVGVQIETTTKVETAAKTSTVVTVNPDGTTSTSTISTPAQSVSTTVTSNGTTKTTVVTSPDGTSSTTSSPVPDSEQEPDKAEDPCIKNPNRIGCLEVDTPDGEIPKSSKTITYQAENPFSDGSCPVNLVAQLGTLGKSVTVWDWSKTCEMSLPLRALVLALASFAAFLIIMPGKVET